MSKISSGTGLKIFQRSGSSFILLLRIPWETPCTKIPTFLLQILQNFSSKRWWTGGEDSSPLVFPKISFPFPSRNSLPRKPNSTLRGSARSFQRREGKRKKRKKKITWEEGTDEKEAWNCLKHSLIICKSDKSPSTKIPRRFLASGRSRAAHPRFLPPPFHLSAKIPPHPAIPARRPVSGRRSVFWNTVVPLSIARNGGIFRGQGRRGGCLSEVYIYIY